MNEDYAKILDKLESELRAFQFESFSSGAAWKIGVSLRERALAEEKPVTIHIVRHGQVLFHHALDGTRPDNDAWVERKTRTVCRFNKSSLYMGFFLKKLGMTLDEKYHVSEHEYCIQGGGFPVIIKNTGVIGAVTVSGMTEEEDHLWAADAVRAYLNIQEE
ncbi:MAG: heme-degrading domain-containing protein [Spirochaetales bacterium]|jgi:uncharacterized protein (UPF0303 family)|nr:heme-degrading domain-containing protein [Spirochaetales bacterium]